MSDEVTIFEVSGGKGIDMRVVAIAARRTLTRVIVGAQESRFGREQHFDPSMCAYTPLEAIQKARRTLETLRVSVRATAEEVERDLAQLVVLETALDMPVAGVE